jgi:hypothetical protein
MSATLSCKVLLVWTAVPLYNYMPTHTTSHTRYAHRHSHGTAHDLSGQCAVATLACNARMHACRLCPLFILCLLYQSLTVVRVCIVSRVSLVRVYHCRIAGVLTTQPAPAP